MEKIAIFIACYGISFGLVPKGCPKRYVEDDFESRKAFAKWLEKDGNYLYKRKNGISVYRYFAKDCLFLVQIVEVDVSRPWMLYARKGKERVWYLDKIDKNNQVIPEVVPVAKIVSL